MKHILVETKKELHGWYPGKRECTAERMLINPYNGCSVGCFYCYARALPGYFEIFHNEGTIFVSKDFDKTIAKQLDSIDVVTCGYLSPVTDPFQEIEKEYHLSEKIVRVFVERNIPIEFITKSVVPESVIEMIKSQKHSFGQVSILTDDEDLRRVLAPGGATCDQLFDNISRLSKNNIFAVCRLDPIFPYITDNKDSLKKIISRAVDSGAKHIIASVLDIPAKISDWILQNIKKHFGTGIYYEYKRFYTEKIGYINANINYRKKIFDFLRNECDRRNITFALCMEYEIVGSGSNLSAPSKQTVDGQFIEHEKQIKGLNSEFMSSINCEGIDIPVYIRKGEKFQPATDCLGNCLNCKDAKCGISDLAMARSPDTKKDFKLKDYKKWSEEIKQIRIPVV